MNSAFHRAAVAEQSRARHPAAVSRASRSQRFRSCTSATSCLTDTSRWTPTRPRRKWLTI